MTSWAETSHTQTHTHIDPNDLHNEEEVEGMLEGTGLIGLDLDQDPQDAFKNKMGNFEEAYLQKSYARAQVNDDETVTILIRSRQIGSKL